MHAVCILYKGKCTGFVMKILKNNIGVGYYCDIEKKKKNTSAQGKY